ncbi:hypothetical protein KAR91_85555 [Candidatus Pacearchaeota archaeon]|nr:hypothetical protein [Candidatus Pacearchaeota archaeon]
MSCYAWVVTYMYDLSPSVCVMSDDIELLGWVSNGMHREIVVRVMTARMTPSQIRKRAMDYIERVRPRKGDNARMDGICFNHVSRALRQLARRGVVRCLNEDCKVGRIYELTQPGIKLQETLEQY